MTVHIGMWPAPDPVLPTDKKWRFDLILDQFDHHRHSICIHEIRVNGVSKNGNIDSEEDAMNMLHLSHSHRCHAPSDMVESLKPFQVGGGDLNKSLYEEPGLRAPSCCRPDGFEGLMGFPPVTVIEQVDGV